VKPRRRKKLLNPILVKMMTGRMRFRRRLDVPMWDAEHLDKVVNILTDGADKIKRIRGNNELRTDDKLMCAQMIIQSMQSDLQRMKPLDPRERGAEKLEYTSFGLIDRNGHDAVQARGDGEI
jgi:hypothetical protein